MSMLAAESPSEVNCPTTRGVSSWAILCAHLSAERLSFPITSVRSKFAVQIPLNAGIYVSKTTVQVNEMDMQERRQKLLNLNKIRGFDESHPISVSQEVFHPGQFYVHIFQLNDSHFQLHLYGLSLQYRFLYDLDISHFFP
jgi:hypothetical protein